MGANTKGEMMKKVLYTSMFLFLTLCVHAQIATPTWRIVGPTLFPVNGTGQINGIGRVTKIKFDPIQPGKLYATSASGGLWISTDAGVTWTGTGTDRMPSHKEATVCIDYTNTQVIYLGTGDPNYYYAGYGVWKSTDGGATFISSSTGMGNLLIDELLMLPTDHNVLIAATNNGIYKSTNAGGSWTQKQNSSNFTDMDFKPGASGRVIYACTTDSFFRSDDAGDTWIKVTNGFYIPDTLGGLGMRIAVSPADTNLVYLGMVADRGTIFKSTDGGHSLTLVKDSFALSLTGYNVTDGGQGDYNFDFNADPVNPNILYWVSHCVWRSDLGGIPSSWQKLTSWYAGVHTDMHHIIFDPHDHTKLYNANDGAIWISRDSGATWTERSDGLDASEIAPAASSRLDKNTISIGTQDNGELYFDSIWITNRGGDWYTRMDYDYFHPQTVYYANGNRRLVYAGDQSLNLPLVNGYNAIVFSRHDQDLAFAASDTLFRTRSLSASSPAWGQLQIFPNPVQALAVSPADSNKLFVITNDDTLHISSDALSATPTFISIHTPGSTYNTAGIVVIDHSPNVLYMYNSTLIFRSIDTGHTWVSVEYNYPPLLDIVGMVHDRFTYDQSIFIANTGGVYYHSDTMTRWQNYSANLPSVADIQGLDQFNNGSPYSVLRAQYYGRGIWEAPMNTVNRSIAANFSSDLKYVCAGHQVHFYDSTYNNPTAWQWTFAGGTPSSSASRNPVVTYSQAGTYPVTLTASNSRSSDSKTITTYISVYGIDTIPVSEGFEDSIFPPGHWVSYDAGNDSVTWMRANYGAYTASGHSMYFDNYYKDATGKVDKMMYGADLTHYDSVLLTFDHAYQTLKGYSDSLEVIVSADCGYSYRRVYIEGGSLLATAPHLDSPSAPFYPTSSQWRTDTVYLYSYAGQDIIVAFGNVAGYGTDLYVDNINLRGKKAAPNSLQSILTDGEGITVYPNPTQGMILIRWSRLNVPEVKVTITNVLGQKVKETTILVTDHSYGMTGIDISALPAGTYYVRSEADISQTDKVILMK